MGVEHWDRQRALALLRRLHMGNIIVEHLAIAIQPPDRYTTGCTLIGRKSVTTTRHAGKACLRAWPWQNSLHEAYYGRGRGIWEGDPLRPPAAGKYIAILASDIIPG